jgi:DNA-binding GntR family transcriptional regulator
MAEPSTPPVPPRTPAVTPQREAVVTHIRRAIVLGHLEPGAKLREVKLAAALNVSRPTLREALNLLVQDGLLAQEPYRGFSVARLEPAAIRDIATTRVPLDLIAVRAVLEDGAGGRMQRVRDAWTQFERVAFDPDPLVQHEAHVAFHRGLWVASENAMLIRLWPVTEALTTIALAQDQAVRADPQRAHTLHKQLVDAILSSDLARIEEQLRHHTVDSAEEFLTLTTTGRRPPRLGDVDRSCIDDSHS